jgi:hypothetical protein
MRTPPEARAAFPILAFFQYSHLPPALQSLSAPIGNLALELAMQLPISAETSAGLRKLLEAKDCFVRAALPVPAAPSKENT